MIKKRNKIKYENVTVKKGTFLRMLSYLIKYIFRLLFVILFFVVSMFAQVYTNLYLKILIDEHVIRMLNEATYGKINFLPFYNSIIHYIILLVIGIICNFIYSIVMVRIGESIMMDIREQMFKKMETLPISYFDKNDTGDIMSRYTLDLDTMRNSLTNSIPQCFAALFSFVTIIGSMMILSVNLTLVAILTFLVMFFITKKLSNISISANIKAQNAIGNLDGYVEEMIKGAKEVKLFSYEDRNIIEFNNRNKNWRENAKIADTMSIILMPINNGFGNVIYILSALVGGYIVVNNINNYYLFGVGSLTLGMIVSFLSFSKNFTREISNISNQVPYIYQSLSGANRIFELLDVESEVDNGEYRLSNDGYWVNGNEKIKVEGNIEVNNVYFSYDKNKQILKDINIYARPGQKVALVGQTGAGKTTITNLINRFYDIDSGCITYDGIDITKIYKKDLRRAMAVVLQDVNLFYGTILDNIRYGNLNATDEECIRAAKETYASFFIEQLENGYNTIINGDTGDLSQGQKQLLAIARAYIANPPFIILDEATSNIDARTEKLVQTGMDKKKKNRTVFVIAHRLSTIINSDVIMVMNNGEIVERGSHNELLNKKGRYYNLYTGHVELE